MIAIQEQKLIAQHTLDIGEFAFYSNIIVGEINEGAHVTFENAVMALQLSEQIYGTNYPVIYISHRKNSYSIDPIGYYEAVKLFPNLSGFAIVAQHKHRRMLASLEKLFLKKPIRVFDNLDSAFVWSKKILEATTRP